MAARVKATAEQSFSNRIEEAIVAALGEDLEPADRMKLLAVAVRFLAVKAKIVTGEHGSAYLEEDDDDADSL